MEVGTAIGMVMDVLSMLATLLALGVAVGVAVVMSRRKMFVGASWLLVLGRAGVFVAALAFLLASTLLVRLVGYDVVQVVYIVFKLLLLLSGCLVAIALLLFNPKKLPGSEVTHG